MANPAAVRLLCARAVAKLLGKAFLDLILPASHPNVLAGLKKVADPGGAPLAGLHCLKLDAGAVAVAL